MHGINLELSLSSYEQSNNDVSFESEFIFNGVCVRFKGRLNKHTLIGEFLIEFNRFNYFEIIKSYKIL